MKKVFALALAVLLMLSLTVPAAAQASPGAKPSDSKKASPLPVVVENTIKTEDGAIITVDPMAADDSDLTQDEKNAMADAQKAQAEGAKGMKSVLNFFYARVTKTSTDGTTSKDAAGNLTIKVDDPANLVVKQYINGQWVELKDIIDNGDGTVTIQNVVNAPIMIGTK